MSALRNLSLVEGHKDLSSFCFPLAGLLLHFSRLGALYHNESATNIFLFATDFCVW